MIKNSWIRLFPRTRYIVTLITLLILIAAVNHYVIGEQPDQDPPAKYIGEILVPDGYIRSQTATGSFGAWLSDLQLKPPASRIRLYNGKLKLLQSALYQVVDLPIGNKDLQQCADAAIRLRSDYLLSRNMIGDIAFNFTSGDRARYSDWIAGYRPRVDGNNVSWHRVSKVDSSYEAYQAYLRTVFMYAGSYSLSRELVKVKNVEHVIAGNCFIKGGFPGHVIIVVDIAVDTLSGEKLVLLAQGYTPAQDIHIIRNPSNSELSPWFRVGKGPELVTTEWDFEWSALYSFDKTE